MVGGGTEVFEAENTLLDLAVKSKSGLKLTY